MNFHSTCHVEWLSNGGIYAQFKLFSLFFSILDLNHAKPEPLVKFLPLILNKLILLLVIPPSVLGQVMNIGQTTFEAIAMLVRNVTVSPTLILYILFELIERRCVC
jgi:hypothetical protein